MTHLLSQFTWKLFDNTQQSYFIGKPTLTEENLPDQSGKVHIVTGGYGGVGRELATILYGRNAVVYIAGRSESKYQAAVETIKGQHGDSKGRIEFLHVDLSDLSTIKPAIAAFTSKEKRLDVLVNNAGVMMCPSGSKGAQGHELQMVTNVLGPFLLTKGLMPLLKETATASPPSSVRVAWASSVTANITSPYGGVVFDKDGVPVSSAVQAFTYGQSKAANNYLAAEMHRRYGAESGVLHVAFNPGNLQTDLQRHLNTVGVWTAKVLSHPPKFGAYTELYSGWSPDLNLDDGGMFIVPWGRKGNGILRADIRSAIEQAATDERAAPRLIWDWCEKETAKFA